MNNSLPKMFRLRQNFPASQPLDIKAALDREFDRVRPQIKPGRIAVGVGSRGITNLAEIVKSVVDHLRKAGAHPFIIPAMGSHGGATPEGQTQLLACYGITEDAMKVPIRASLDVREVGKWENQPVYCSTEALDADGIVLINRIKPHTDFAGKMGSGLLKMSVIGLGKRTGATAMHVAASRVGHERAIRGMAEFILKNSPILFGVAILENQWHQTAKLVVLPREDFVHGEEQLFAESWKLMPLLPFDEIDLLIVDRIGKNISGTGMDTNVIGRGVHGYSSSLMRGERPAPFIRRIFVRDMSPDTHGNAIGVGLADVTTTRLVRAIDHHVTAVNALTSLTPQSAKIPIYFDTDREAIDLTLASLAIPDIRAARVVRIRDTLNLDQLDVSESLLDEAKGLSNLTVMSSPGDMRFANDGMLAEFHVA